MRQRTKTAALLTGVLLVAACGGSGDDGDDAAGIASFGAAFVAMFAADPNEEPVDAQSIDIAINPTADPFNP
ncbi:hypothetical protein JQV27_20305 [Sulfitobacter mediterraneus]|uniref:hypothetical protein n=1 Tax=Sulfitobacter mediterraneus TaxID=83219 RepID=UPI001931C7C1|nr:hypothetical protein [Sulfitobacter mediterraneus]MBM1635188.1 hypothetical protein [Sulfitobacter mediterraneus]MBM1643039.1 hypothetical protein [Sulfitobacter mediterraneus]MBM1647087.1 hypothetical protein [Sulfitobacter mediterraneus]MBM1651129.1 hypothetical protein [Sulfitobacter mediterraneus]MBM1655144.1 hypothetical protein [Sulfitobacter mediterraneus]